MHTHRHLQIDTVLIACVCCVRIVGEFIHWFAISVSPPSLNCIVIQLSKSYGVRAYARVCRIHMWMLACSLLLSIAKPRQWILLPNEWIETTTNATNDNQQLHNVLTNEVKTTHTDTDTNTEQTPHMYRQIECSVQLVGTNASWISESMRNMIIKRPMHAHLKIPTKYGTLMRGRERARAVCVYVCFGVLLYVPGDK